MKLSQKAKRKITDGHEREQEQEDEVPNGFSYAKTKRKSMLCLHKENEKSEEMVKRLVSYCKRYGNISWIDLCPTTTI